MAKVTLSILENLESQTSFLQGLEENFAELQDAIDNTVSRDGSTPNSMGADFDMNGYRIINLPAPQGANDPVRLQDLQAAEVEGGGTSLPSQTGNAGKYLKTDGTAVSWSSVPTGAGTGDMLKANNLSDVSSISSARANLGLGSAATKDTGTSGATVPLLNATATWSQIINFTAGINVTGTTEVRLTYTPSALSDDSAGFRGIPVNTQNGNYTFVLNDSGRMVRHTTGSHAYTIPPNSSVAYPVGTAISVRNTGTAVTLTRGAGVTLRAAGASTDTNFTLAQWGLATLVQEAANVWLVTGTGLS